MSLIEIFLPRRPRSSSAAHCAQTCQPCVEVLEERQCLSIAAPSGLHAVAISATQVKLTWNDVVGEQGFRIFRWDGTQSILVVGKGVTAYTVKNLQANASYFFSVEAHDLSTSARSSWVSIATPADAITVPTHVHIGAITQTSLTVQWTNASGATGYNVYSWDGNRAFLIGSTTPSVPSLKINNLTSGVAYYFYVQATNATNSVNSDWVSATTLSTGIAAPSNVKAQGVGPSNIALSWNNVANASGYTIYIWNGNANSSPTVLATLAAHTTGYQAIGLLPGATYWFYVQATSGGNFANSPWVTATTVAALPLQPPTQLSVNITGPNSVTLSWVEPARAVGYRVFVWAGTYWSQVMTVPAGTHTVPINGLGENLTHWFFVQAFTDNFAEVSYSIAVFANL
jgi:hypothetical protein